MRVLLDSHVLLWALGQTDRLDLATRNLLADPDTEVLFSAASIWEITAAVETDFVEVPVRSGAAAVVASLPPYHRDRFDRLLAAQAITEPAHLLTVDANCRPTRSWSRCSGDTSPCPQSPPCIPRNAACR